MDLNERLEEIRRRITDRRQHEADDDEQPLPDDDVQRIPVVLCVMPACPDCGSTWKRTRGRYGAVRYHVCLDCGCEYHSRQMRPDQIRPT